MSDGGGDSGGGGKGGDSGGGGKGGDSGGASAGPVDYGSGPGAGGYSDPSASSSSYGGGGGSSALGFAGPSTTDTSLDGFVNDPSQGNLTGPGPVGGGSGIPGDGGGTNTPFSWTDNLPNLNGVSAGDFTGGGTGAPTSAGGVFDTGTSAATSSSGFDNLVSGNNPGAASAAGTAAPTGVSGNTDISSSLAKPVDPYAKGSANSGGSAGGGSNMLSSLGLGGNPLGTLAAGAGLASNLSRGNSAPPQSAALTANANAATATGAQQTAAGQALQQWQTTGKLPDSYESQVQRAAQDAKTRAVSNAAAQGLPTDPTQNTALAQQLNAIDAAIPGQREAIAAQLAQSGQSMINAGLQATGISSGVYQTLANLENSQNQQRGQAISNFAAALNGGNRGVTLKVA